MMIDLCHVSVASAVPRGTAYEMKGEYPAVCSDTTTTPRGGQTTGRLTQYDGLAWTAMLWEVERGTATF